MEFTKVGVMRNGDPILSRNQFMPIQLLYRAEKFGLGPFGQRQRNGLHIDTRIGPYTAAGSRVY